MSAGRPSGFDAPVAARTARGSGSISGGSAITRQKTPASRQHSLETGKTVGDEEGSCSGTHHGVMAECYKITPGTPGSNAVTDSITMIKYTALKQQVGKRKTVTRVLCISAVHMSAA